MPSNAAEDEPERSEDKDPKGHKAESSEPGPDASAGRERKQKKQRSFWKELPILIVVALVLAFLIQQFLARVYMIPSGSMEQTLHGCAGCTPDRILVDKITYDFTDPEPGDVVVFRGPPAWIEGDLPPEESDNAVANFFQSIGSVFGLAPPDERDFVKRIIATGGQTVECCDDQNRVLVDGKPLDEPYIYWQGAHEQAEFDPVEVPEGTVWVMGDNRNNSSDSRYQGDGGARGAVPVDNIIGKARFIVLPPSRWGTVSDHNPQAASASAMSAPAWQQGVPLGIGVLAAWPTLLVGRRLGAAVRGTVRRGR
ncbi:signal peptidase I [Prauserella endophytica]|uniref:Signal peptidase I n=1 Tax=Prauserella endophytica TaxID=1592324 RepID=A0ABY2S6V7_9PSEU|nr:signal peptidase I [Prauserella endophytica]PXY26239.1 signal peptidase I [Prauserella coralliicola]TKG71648.1 signal peptidase I [Prauserella endophytica]